jgi:epoxyqueuosine reductase
MGISPVEPLGGGWFHPHKERFEAWVDAGAHAGMEWIVERAAARVCPEVLLPDVKTAIVLWMNHRFPTPERPSFPTGRVARYAWGRDYHNILRKVVRRLSRWIQERVPNARCHGSVDTSPVLERAFGERAAVGWIGKSTMLIHPNEGTYGSLAVLFTTVELPTAPKAHPHRCGTCVDCWTVCPTQALSAEGLDARRCISYWTIEHRGLVPRALRSSLGEWVFGCDLCQDICPWNRKAPFADERAEALWRPQVDRAWPNLIEWLTLSDEELNQSLLGSPLRRAFPHGLKRNAITTLTNLESIEALPTILACLSHPEYSVRGTAVWGSATLALRCPVQERRDTLAHLIEYQSAETHSEVRDEYTWAINQLTAHAS